MEIIKTTDQNYVEMIKQKNIKSKAIKNKTGYYSQIRSRHPSHDVFRNKQELKFPFRSVIRFGSSTELPDTLANGGKRIELNSTEAIKNSASKLRMKNCFLKAGVKTAIWWTLTQKQSGLVIRTEFDVEFKDSTNLSLLPYPIVAKSHFGSRGNGNYLLNSQEELQQWMKNKDLNNYIFEKFYNYVREYRVHVSENGCFYTCRKMIKQEFKGTDNAWQRHNDNCVWIVEENPLFDKPVNWNKIIEECVKALKSTGLDFGACDIRVQSAKNNEGQKRKEVDFIIIEINSAPSFGDRTEKEYLKELPKLLTNKYKI